MKPVHSSADRLKLTVFLLLSLAVYSGLVVPHIKNGAVSVDLHGVLSAVNQFLETGVYISRPPGHAANEIYVLAPVALFLKSVLNVPFAWPAYLVYLYVSGLACLLIFFLIIRKLTASAWGVFACIVSFALSPSFLRQTLEGEEFLGGLCFVLGSLLLLVLYRQSDSLRMPFLLASVGLAAFATGFRPEMALYALVFPIYFLFQATSGTKHMLWAILTYGMTLAVVWLPIVLSSTALTAYPIPHTFFEKLMAGSYKLLFQAYSLPVACLFLVSLATSVRASRECSRFSPDHRWLFWSGLIVSVSYGAVFFYYPTKPEFLLITVPFLLLMLVLGNRQTLLTFVVVSTVISPAFGLDILENRHLVGLHVTPGEYRRIVAEKPGKRVQYLARLREMIAQPEPIIVIGRFDERLLNFLKENGEGESFVHRSVVWHNHKVLALSLPTVAHSELVSSDVLGQGGYVRKDGMIDILREFQTKGYGIAVDRAAFRRWRYLFLASDGLNADHVELDGVRVLLF